MAQRMSSPDGSEVLTVADGVGASVLASLGWKTESNSSPKRSRSEENTAQSALSDSTESAGSGEAGRKRSPGRPRKHPVEGE